MHWKSPTAIKIIGPKNNLRRIWLIAIKGPILKKMFKLNVPLINKWNCKGINMLWTRLCASKLTGKKMQTALKAPNVNQRYSKGKNNLQWNRSVARRLNVWSRSYPQQVKPKSIAFFVPKRLSISQITTLKKYLH